MRQFMVCSSILAILGQGVGQVAIAHHSFAMFDMDMEVTVQGTVKDFQYTNPHSWLIISVPNTDGTQVDWSFESEGPSTLLRAGIRRSSLVAGEKVTVRTHPMRDGRPGGSWIAVTKEDGTILNPHKLI